jgi:ankyrin repeat protein
MPRLSAIDLSGTNLTATHLGRLAPLRSSAALRVVCIRGVNIAPWDVHRLSPLLFVGDAAVEQQLDDAAERERRRVAFKLYQHAEAVAAAAIDLWSAVRLGDESAIQVCMDAGASLRATTTGGGLSALDVAQQTSHMPLLKPYLLASSEIALLHASVRGDLAKVKRLLAIGADVATTDANGWTPLMLATHSNHRDVVKLLLSAGAAVNVAAKRSAGLTALVLALKRERVDIVQCLLDAKADGSGVSADGRTTLMLAAQLGDVRLLTRLLQLGVRVDAEDCQKQTALMHAVARGFEAVVRALLSDGARVGDALAQACVDGNVAIVEALADNDRHALVASHGPLLCASLHGHARCVSALLDRGADVNCIDDDGITALMLASKGSVDVVTILLAHGANVNARTTKGTTALMGAADRGCVDIVKLLVTKGARVNDATQNGVTALMFAAQRGETMAMRALCASGSVDVDVMTTDGHKMTALALAVAHQHSESVKWLLENGAKVTTLALKIAVQRRNVALVNALLAKACTVEWEVLAMACSGGACEVVESLLSKRCVDVNSRGEHGITALMFAVVSEQADVVELLCRAGADTLAPSSPSLHYAVRLGNTRMVRCLLDAGADVNVTTGGQVTPLMTAVREGHMHLLDILVSAGAEVHGAALISAVFTRNERIVSRLVELGADPNAVAPDGEGFTPLLLAIELGAANVVHSLLRAGADAELARFDGVTPLMLAVMCERDTVVGELIAGGVDVNARLPNGASALDIAETVKAMRLASRLRAAGAMVRSDKGPALDARLLHSVDEKTKALSPILLPDIKHDLLGDVDAVSVQYYATYSRTGHTNFDKGAPEKQTY